ncbi:MAG: helix-turn-helix transcriptional regulator [Lachnospiraceae bacterium]|nr:helix-turn-helix transcriptional regulator [Lachnospiraceae bacterium]
MTFGERLYELRTKKNISQEKFAEIMDVSRQSISKWETDRAYPEMSRLIFMSDYFQVSLDYLVRGKEYEEREKAETLEPKGKYFNKNMWAVWNTFITNLSGSQKTKFILLYCLVTFALFAIVLLLSYGCGYVLGQFVYHLLH